MPQAARALWLMAACFGVVSVAELAWPDEDTPAAPPVVRPTAGVAAPPPIRAQDWAATMLERPLFAPGRRPDAVAPGVVAQAPGAPSLPRLSGILVTSSGRRAIFVTPGNEGRPTVVAEGGAIGAWRVDAIRTADVQLTGPDGKRVLRPSYSHTETAPPGPAGLQP